MNWNILLKSKEFLEENETEMLHCRDKGLLPLLIENNIIVFLISGKNNLTNVIIEMCSH